MNLKNVSFLLLLVLFSSIAFPSSRTSEDRRAIDEMTQAIGPYPIGLNKTIFFLRPNHDICMDSMPIILKDIFKKKVDSIGSIGKRLLKICNYRNEDYPIYEFSCKLLLNSLFPNKNRNYSVDIYVDTVEEIIGISSLKWQPGRPLVLIEPPKSNSSYAIKVLNLFLKRYKNAEYIGSSKLKCSINDNFSPFQSYANQFWNWFKKNEEYLYGYDKDKERIDKNITRKLWNAYFYDTSFKIGPIQNNKREIIFICSEGDWNSFSKSIPNLRFWKVSFKNK